MSDRPRVLIENSVYHIIMRGNQKQTVFQQNEDYHHFLYLLRKYKNRYDAKLYAYCLMKNHIHLVLEPYSKATLHKLIHDLSLSYVKWYNHKYNKCGHLWQGRFKSFILQKDQYLLNCISYVELNPVRSNLCLRPEEYPWSSYNARICGAVNCKLISDLIL